MAESNLSYANAEEVGEVLAKAESAPQPESMEDYARLTGPQAFDGEQRFLDGIIIRSADGTLWNVTVSDAGALTIEEKL